MYSVECFLTLFEEKKKQKTISGNKKMCVIKIVPCNHYRKQNKAKNVSADLEIVEAAKQEEKKKNEKRGQ